MERQLSMKLERTSSMDAEPRTLSKEQYDMAWAAAKIAHVRKLAETTKLQVVDKADRGVVIKSTTETGQSSITHKYIFPPMA